MVVNDSMGLDVIMDKEIKEADMVVIEHTIIKMVVIVSNFIMEVVIDS